jgi:hypothetical protein
VNPLQSASVQQPRISCAHVGLFLQVEYASGSGSAASLLLANQARLWSSSNTTPDQGTLHLRRFRCRSIEFFDHPDEIGQGICLHFMHDTPAMQLYRRFGSA